MNKFFFVFAFLFLPATAISFADQAQQVTTLKDGSQIMDQQIAAGQKQLISNPQIMAMILEMVKDPEIIQALSDPSLVQAVTSHNYKALQSNPKFQALINTPKMQELLQKITAQQQQQNTSSQ